MDSDLSEDFEVKVWMYKDQFCHLLFLQWWLMLSMILPEVVQSELLYADYLLYFIDY